ncbi:MAG: uncharacterized protein A8A55_1630 [Amphiamblys sp. WSBS2006]|nr:MAG: uncharacterized protein A8A55_1630 [Amphiamblys sp. WSBS2006]
MFLGVVVFACGVFCTAPDVILGKDVLNEGVFAGKKIFVCWKNAPATAKDAEYNVGLVNTETKEVFVCNGKYPACDKAVEIKTDEKQTGEYRVVLWEGTKKDSSVLLMKHTGFSEKFEIRGEEESSSEDESSSEVTPEEESGICKIKVGEKNYVRRGETVRIAWDYSKAYNFKRLNLHLMKENMAHVETIANLESCKKGFSWKVKDEAYDGKYYIYVGASGERQKMARPGKSDPRGAGSELFSIS